jgi:hypothetical protein
VLVVGAAQLRPAALTVSAALERDDEAGLARLDRWQIPALRPAPAPAAVPIVALPGYKDPPSRSTARRGAPRLKRSPTPPQEVTPVEAGSAVVDASSESREKPDLLPVPIPVRGALLGTEGVTVLMARRMP